MGAGKSQDHSGARETDSGAEPLRSTQLTRFFFLLSSFFFLLSLSSCMDENASFLKKGALRKEVKEVKDGPKVP
jgi:hypothetical protein